MKVTGIYDMNKIIFFFYYFVSSIFIVGILLSFYGLGFSGYYTDKIINWIWLAFTLVIILKFWKNKITKIFVSALVSMVLLSILPMGIPFFGIVYYFSTLEDYQQISLNKKYRIERTRQHALAPQQVYIYEKRGVLEKNISRPHYKEIVEKTLNTDTIAIESLPIRRSKFIGINKENIIIE